MTGLELKGGRPPLAISFITLLPVLLQDRPGERSAIAGPRSRQRPKTATPT